ncbi:MAG: hypothetical protein AB7I38_14345 [Dehalococcoidia bacterium]
MNRDDAVTAVAEALRHYEAIDFGPRAGYTERDLAVVSRVAVAALEPYIAARIAAETEALRSEVERDHDAHIDRLNDMCERLGPWLVEDDVAQEALIGDAITRMLEALSLALAEHEPEDVPDSEHYYCRPADCDRAGEGVLVARCKTCETVHPCATRRSITGEDA